MQWLSSNLPRFLALTLVAALLASQLSGCAYWQEWFAASTAAEPATPQDQAQPLKPEPEQKPTPEAILPAPPSSPNLPAAKPLDKYKEQSPPESAATSWAGEISPIFATEQRLIEEAVAWQKLWQDLALPMPRPLPDGRVALAVFAGEQEGTKEISPLKQTERWHMDMRDEAAEEFIEPQASLNISWEIMKGENKDAEAAESGINLTTPWRVEIINPRGLKIEINPPANTIEAVAP